MHTLYRCALDPADKARTERIEPFDEFEEWHMIQVGIIAYTSRLLSLSKYNNFIIQVTEILCHEAGRSKGPQVCQRFFMMLRWVLV